MTKSAYFVFGLLFLFSGVVCAELNLDKLSPSDINEVKSVLTALEPLIKQRDSLHNLASLTFDELYAPLNEKQKNFLKQFEHLDANALSVKIPYLGISQGDEDFVILTGQKIKLNGQPYVLPPQFLPRDVNENFTKMMDAMFKDIGKRLYVESAYRSSAYQLYLFVFYLKNHDYSIRQTTKFVALPGYSEHGCPRRQALDFINENGINGENDPNEFDVLPEYIWLTKNARRFGFELSYPKNSTSGITYEPWHWRKKCKE